MMRSVFPWLVLAALFFERAHGSDQIEAWVVAAVGALLMAYLDFSDWRLSR